MTVILCAVICFGFSEVERVCERITYEPTSERPLLFVPVNAQHESQRIPPGRDTLKRRPLTGSDIDRTPSVLCAAVCGREHDCHAIFVAAIRDGQTSEPFRARRWLPLVPV